MSPCTIEEVLIPHTYYSELHCTAMLYLYVVDQLPLTLISVSKGWIDVTNILLLTVQSMNNSSWSQIHKNTCG